MKKITRNTKEWFQKTLDIDSQIDERERKIKRIQKEIETLNRAKEKHLKTCKHRYASGKTAKYGCIIADLCKICYWSDL